MKRAILFALVAFVTTLAGTTGILVKMHHPVPFAAADSTPVTPEMPVADSALPPTRVDTVRSDSALSGREAAGGTPAPGTVEVADSTPAPARPVRRNPPVDPAARTAAFKQVARVLSAMKAPEAAQVLGLLNDEEVEGILRAVGPRQAADFLTNLPRERAANLSRRLLVPKAAEASR